MRRGGTTDRRLLGILAASRAPHHYVVCNNKKECGGKPSGGIRHAYPRKLPQFYEYKSRQKPSAQFKRAPDHCHSALAHAL